MASSGSLKLLGSKALVGEIRPPGDKSISHRAVIFSLLARGRSEIFGISRGQDILDGITIAAELGAEVTDHGSRVIIESRGILEPSKVLDVGNSGTLIRLLSGVLACRDGHFVLSGDISVNSRPMARVIEPLNAMGAKISGRAGNTLAPMSIVGSKLRGMSFSGLVPSAQVKSAILLGGLGADSQTSVHEAIQTRPHTEDMLAEAGVDVQVCADATGTKVTVQPQLHLLPNSWRVPGDTSQAAFWIVGGLIARGSRLLVKDVLVHPTRSGLLDVLKRMGAELEIHPVTAQSSDVTVYPGPLSATTVSGGEVTSMIDEIPILAIAAARAEGTTVIRDAAELRVKESDRIATTCRMLRSFGVEVEEFETGMAIKGSPKPFLAAEVDSAGDHRIAMSAAIGSLVVDGETLISGTDCVSTSYPGFFSKLGLLSV